jgi:putative ABC transport system permease protein
LQLSYRSRTSKAMVQGVTPGFLQARNMSVTSGRFWDESAQQQNQNVVVLGASLAEKMFDRRNPIGQEIQIGISTFQVIGVLERKGAFLGVNPDAEAHIPITTMANQVAGRRVPVGVAIDQMEVSARDRSRIRSAAFQVTNILTRLRGKQDFSVIANKSVQDLLGQITGVLSILLSAIATVSLVVGGIGIMNIMLVSVTERTKEIGLRKALGAREQTILQQFLIEAVILSITGGIIGISLGLSITLLIGVFTPLKPSVPISALVLATGVSGGIGLIFGVIPARQAAKLDPIVALRST